MEAMSLIRAVAALVLVLGLIGAAAWAAKRYGAARFGGLTRGKSARLKVVEVLAIDARTKLVLVRQDAQEHLLVIGSGQATTVSRGPASQPDGPA
ncbi:MAG: FliO/MopB family protein [Dongiaceae bacterium]